MGIAAYNRGSAALRREIDADVRPVEFSGHTAVVFLDGKSGCVALDACVPIIAAPGTEVSA